MSYASWRTHWMAVRKRVEADPELQRLSAQLSKLAAGGAAHKRLQRQYLARRRLVEEQASRDQTLVEIADERANRAAYMRDYRARKRAMREAVREVRTPAVRP